MGRDLEWKPDDVVLLQAYKEEGRKQNEIAALLGRSEHSISRKLKLLRRVEIRRLAKPPLGCPRKLWTNEDHDRLVQMRDHDKLPFDRIALELGRTLSACETKYRDLLGLNRPNAATSEMPGPRISAAQIADRDERRRLQHHDFTAAFFGDPLPGRSALDQRSVAR